MGCQGQILAESFASGLRDAYVLECSAVNLLGNSETRLISAQTPAPAEMSRVASSGPSGAASFFWQNKFGVGKAEETLDRNPELT